MDLIERAHSFNEKRSAVASAICRQLGFAAIALIWAFRVLDQGQCMVRGELVTPTLLVVASLGLDLLHYTIAALLWGGYGRFLEGRKRDGHEIPQDAPGWINWPANMLFLAKIALMVWAYWLLFWFFWGEILVAAAV